MICSWCGSNDVEGFAVKRLGLGVPGWLWFAVDPVDEDHIPASLSVVAAADPHKFRHDNLGFEPRTPLAIGLIARRSPWIKRIFLRKPQEA